MWLLFFIIYFMHLSANKYVKCFSINSSFLYFNAKDVMNKTLNVFYSRQRRRVVQMKVK